MHESQQFSANAHLSHAGHLLLQDLGERLGLRLLMPEGALRLTDGDGYACFLEITADGQFWIIHSVLAEYNIATPAMLAHYLHLNGQIERMKGASICLDADRNAIRLCIVLREEGLVIEALENVLAHMTQLHGELLMSEAHA